MKDRELTTQRIFWLWLPLAATWLLMAVENPLIQAFISRMPDVRENLTAFGAALPIVLLIEAPILSIISASNTLVRDRDSYFGMRRFVFIASGVLCLVMLLLVLPGPYAYISREMLRLNAQTADLCWVVVLCFVPAPFTVAYRRMIQGILIHGGLTRKVGMATLVRLAAVGIVLGAAAAGRIAGAIAGAMALSVAFAAEALAVRFMARRLMRELLAREVAADAAKMTLQRVWAFYFPLALTAVMFHSMPAMLAYFMARAPLAHESIAILPIIQNFSFLFGCFVFAMQEVIISRGDGGTGEHAALRRFMLYLCGAVILAQVVVLFTPLVRIIFFRFYQLPIEFSEIMIVPVRLSVVILVLFSWNVWQRAILIRAQKTRPITWASLLDLGTVCAVMAAMMKMTAWSGVMCAVVAIICGRTAGISSLYRTYSRLQLSRLGPVDAVLIPSVDYEPVAE